MEKKQTSTETLRKAKEKGAERDTGIVNGEPSFKDLEPGTKTNYKKQLDLWHEFVRENPGTSPYDLYSLQKFVRQMAYGIDGAEGIEKPCSKTVPNTFSSSRIGEYIESTCRPGSGRGLYYRDITFGAFINEYGNPEFAVQLTRDAKNMAKTPHKRPQHALYEGGVPMILCLNPMLPFLARLVVHGAFRDYDTIKQLFRISPPEDEMLQLHWKDELLDTPFFKAQFTKDFEERIETAGAFSKIHRAWGASAEGLYWIDKFYSEATRMVHAGHMDPNTHRRHYTPTNGADGQDTYLGGKWRTIVADLFRGLTVPRNPNLSYEEITTLEGKTDPGSVKRRRKLYDQRRKLTDKELRDWQKRQPNKPNDPPGYHRAIFSRVRFMMPERDSLSRDLFQIDTLRSPTGLRALHAMIALYLQESEVEYRPGLELGKCCCSNPHGNKLEGNRQASYDWKHIYTCYKRSCECVCGFAELCFLCNEWVFGERAWEDHCDGHLSQLQTFPMFCDPLMHGLPASVRLKQFLNRGKWLGHIHKHISCLNAEKPAKCPHPHPYRPTLFDSVKQLQFHLQDSHGIPFIRETVRPKRKRDESEDEMPVQRKRRPRGLNTEADTDEDIVKCEYVFVNSTMEKMQEHGPNSTKSSSSCSTPLQSPDSSFTGDEGPRYSETALSSVCGEELIDAAILTGATGADLDDVEVVDLTNVDKVLSTTISATAQTTNTY
ncbi:uncharacterized protein Z518_11295 [Rhinocladiella mackenziei CBS 650.93]|uniref:Uncharacterized protein n=1 Tax=Rhinocladiella mackenziei CBS 650.93 TaxID=1442369 RepID=A0A0D2FBT8_9EURO|nr:uncharacterized protein Z518_11295 [Rhinocladiella mackenziei CBS 650.93]KIW99556.1 hypothetical protein Z518_11295 [Rhinocladiella mackenziei CBS 650.93]